MALRWAYSSYYWTDCLHVYTNILENDMLLNCAEKMPTHYTFQHDNDPKHTLCFFKDFLKASNVSVLEWPAQSLDLNPIDNM